MSPDADVGKEESFATCLGLVSDLKQILIIPEKMGVPLGVVGIIAPSQQLIRIEVDAIILCHSYRYLSFSIHITVSIIIHDA